MGCLLYTSDIPLIRYAEMYLTRAEAKFRLSGDPQQARDDIKVLRDRAGAVSYTHLLFCLDVV